MELSVVVPCYNEEGRLPGSLRRIEPYLEGRLPLGFELILVDDGSSDGTGAVIRDAGRRHAYVRPLILTPNRGKGAAVAAGVKESQGRLVLISDADFSTPIEELAKLEDAIAGGADVAIGSRAAPGAREVDQPLYRQALGKAFNRLVQVLVLPGLLDTQCGFKLFRGGVARELFGQLRTTRFAFDVEILAGALRAGYRVREVPVRWVNSGSSRVAPVRDSARMLRDVIRIWRQK